MVPPSRTRHFSPGAPLLVPRSTWWLSLVNSGFTSRETSLLWFTVTGTRFIPPQSYLDNEAGKPFIGSSLRAPQPATWVTARVRPLGGRSESRAMLSPVSLLRPYAVWRIARSGPAGVAEDVACAVDADGPSPRT